MKRSYKTKSKIARYWIQWEIDNGRFVPWGPDARFDWGEPACMACGYWSDKWAEKTEARARALDWDNLDHIARAWNDSTLERCHVVPRYLGGSDEVSNLVLMCGVCHALHPDSTDPEATYRWMVTRRGAWVREIAAEMGVTL